MTTKKAFCNGLLKTKNSVKLKRNAVPLYVLLGVVILVSSVSLVVILPPLTSHVVSAKSSASILAIKSEQSSTTNPQFDVHVVYAYIGPRKDHFTCDNPFEDKISTRTLNAVSLYPSIIYFNFTHISTAENESCDAKMDVYLIQLTADTGTTENYTYTEATNYNPAFSDIDSLSMHVNDFSCACMTSKIGGCFVYNWTINTSNLVGRIGSYGSYSSNPSELGLWKASEPNIITLSIYRIGWITASEKSISVVNDASSKIVARIQLEKHGTGFLYNTVVAQDQLSQIDPYNPPIPDS